MNDLTQCTEVDVAELARTRSSLAGELPLSALPRLLADVWPPTGDMPQVRWRLEARSQAQAGGLKDQVWAHLTAQLAVQVTCQSCLEPMPVDLVVDRHFRFVATEEEALLEDEESEEDVLVDAHCLDAYALLEDELLMALPLAPRHGGCIAQYQAPPEVEIAEEKPNPFAALAALKKT